MEEKNFKKTLLKICKGDPEALTILFNICDRYISRLFNLKKLEGFGNEEREELFQRCHIKLFFAASNFKGDTINNFFGYCKKIIINCTKDFIKEEFKKTKFRSQISLEDLQIASNENLAEEVISVIYIKKQWNKFLRDKLTLKERKFLAEIMSCNSLREVAEMEGISYEATRKRKERLLNKILKEGFFYEY